jgi:predicted O-methyltransferase YrrM
MTIFGAVISAHNRLLTSAFPYRPVPLSYWEALHRLGASVTGSQAALTPLPRFQTVRETSVAELRRIASLQDVQPFSLGIAGIELLWHQLNRYSPRTIFECGSGLSTRVLADYAQLFPRRGVRIISIDQNESYLDTTRQQLTGVGLDGAVELIHVPLSEQDEYVLTDDIMSELVREQKIDLVLVDGPFGRPGCRRSTLPRIEPFCSRGAVWMLDDAFRSGELTFLRDWRAQERLGLAGIVPIDKGIAMGYIRG